MASLNQVTLFGRLCRDPELRYTKEGKAVCNFRLAVDKKGRAAEGENNADFIPIAAWERLGEVCGQHLTTGKLIAVAGRLSVRTYEKDGQRQTWTEVVIHEMQMLDRGGEGVEKKSTQSPPPKHTSTERMGWSRIDESQRKVEETPF